MSDFIEYAEYYKKAWESSLKERTSELYAEIKTLRAENARFREALKHICMNDSKSLECCRNFGRLGDLANHLIDIAESALKESE